MRPQKYAYEKYDDGTVWEIDCDEAFGGPSVSATESKRELERFRTAIRLRAHRANKTAHTRVVRGVPARLLLQITNKGEKPAPVFGNVDRNNEIVFLNSFKSCPTCGKSGEIRAARPGGGAEDTSDDAQTPVVSTGAVPEWFK